MRELTEEELEEEIVRIKEQLIEKRELEEKFMRGMYKLLYTGKSSIRKS